MQIKPQKVLEKIPKNKGKPEKRYVQIRGIEKLEEGSRRRRKEGERRRGKGVQEAKKFVSHKRGGTKAGARHEE